jgi:hypothetical protein
MDAVRAERIETGVERIAAALFAGATAYAFYRWMGGSYREPQLALLSAAAAGVAFFLSVGVLRSVPVEEHFDLPAFDLPAIEPLDDFEPEHIDEFRIIERQPPEELLLTDADRLQSLESQAFGELLLTDGDRLKPAGSEAFGELLLTDGDRLKSAGSEAFGELLLTDSDRLHPSERDAPEELVLEDILAELGPESRVVRLFDPAAMPTPAQVKARIERHLGEESAPTAPPDASQALYDALAELRRSLG